MLKDILIPSKIGDSFIFSKRILSFDITQFAVHATLIMCKSNRVHLQNKMSIVLKDFSTQAVVGAIKKIISTVGSYDEIITSLSSSAVVFKELKLPFIGREKLEMIVAYEVESLLPFSLDQAVIDFIITHEDDSKHMSTILVAAALKQDVQMQVGLFEKSGVMLNSMTVDMFALYDLYRHGIFVAKTMEKKKKASTKQIKSQRSLQQRFDSLQHSTVEMFIDVGFDVTRILYLDHGVLKAVRVVPYGVSDIAKSISAKLELSYYDVTQQLINLDYHELYQSEVKEELQKLFENVDRTMSFFEKQVTDGYRKPQKIIFSGLGCLLYQFNELAQSFFDMPVNEIAIDRLMKSLYISLPKKMMLQVQDMTNLSIALFGKYNDTTNFLKNIAYKADSTLLYKQLFMMVLLTISCIGGIFWNSYSELQRWEQAYISSKKELVSTLDNTMGIDVKGERNLTKIVEKAEETLKKKHKLWFAFSKRTEQSYLEYLQDLSVRIDRASIGLNLKQLTLDSEKVTMIGTLKDFEALEVFEEELAELDVLQLVEKPRELSFTIQLKVKDKDQHGIY